MPRVPTIVNVKNPDGSYSSEITISVSVGDLNNGRETVIPTLVAGKQLSVEEAIQAAIASRLRYPSFDSVEDAEAYTRNRSKAGGAGTQGFVGRMPVTHKTKLQLTPKRRTMFEGQRKKAEGLMEKEMKAGKGSGKAYAAAKRAYERAGRLLYGAPKETSPPKKKPADVSPGKNRSKNDVHANRRKPFEKVTGTEAIKAQLEAVAKRALKGNEG